MQRRLAPPVRLFDFDFARAPVESLTRGRSSDGLVLEVAESGLLTAILVYFTLECDESHSFSNGPKQHGLVAWDQNVRTMPIEMRVARGMRLPLSASHDHEAVRVGLPQILPEMLNARDLIGHAELLGKPPEEQLA